MITPTIGRRIWFYPGRHNSAQRRIDHTQPCDAGIVFVHPDGKVNLVVTDHYGYMTREELVAIVQDGTTMPSDRSYAVWMPYQTKVAAEQQTKETSGLNPHVDRSEKIYGVRANTDLDPPDRSVTELGTNAVTPEQIQALKDRVAYLTPARIGDRTSTFVHAYLDGTFYLATGHSACVDPANYSAGRGRQIARRNAEYAVEQKLWELEGYALWKSLR